MQQPEPGTTYNVTDDEPAARLEVLNFARQLTGIGSVSTPKSPAADAPDGGAGATDGQELASQTAASSTAGRSATSGSRAGGELEEKRVRNTRIKERLAVQLTYSTYREGVSAIFRGDTTPFSTEDLLYLYPDSA